MANLFNSNRLSMSRSVILYYWKRSHRNAAEMARMTKISERTIRYNIAKIGEQDSVEHRSGNGRPRKITPESSIAIDKWIRKNNEITTKEKRGKIAGRQKSQCISMGGAASASSNGLQKHFTSSDAYVDKRGKREAGSMGM